MQFKTRQEGRVTHIALEGDLNEELRITSPKILETLTGDSIVFDLAGIRAINSIGVKYWLILMEELSKRTSLQFRACPVAFTSMASMVHGVLGGGKVESVLLPYTCENCGKTKDSLEDMAKLAAQELPESLPCPNCAKAMVLDDGMLEELEFLTQ